MKVAFFLGSLNRGGAETLMADVFSRGGDLPFEAVCIYRNEGNMSEAFHSTTVPMLRLPRKHSWLLYGLRFRRLVLSQKADIVHAQSTLNAAIAIIFLAFTRVKVVMTLHGIGFGNANPLYKRLLYRHCSRIVCVSEWERADYLRLGCCGVEDRFVVIRNGINFSKFGLTRPPVAEGNAVRLCMVGNFVREKDQYFVCRFLKEVMSKGVSFDFYFIGREVPAYQAYYDKCWDYCEQNDLSSCVHFLGAREDVPELLSDMDAFVYASKSETFGIAPVEAMAMGLPTFVNDLDVFVEITQKGELAVLYKTGDVEDLSAKFSDFMLHRQQYYEKAQANASIIRNLYSIATHVDGLHSLYLEIV
jgi:glycosyltransferase involved in cell wall biosynthesis